MFKEKINKKEYERIIEIARSQIGVREATNRNDGERIEGYINYVGFKKGAPYCAAWVSWVFGQAGYKQPRTAWSPALFPKEKLVRDPSILRDDKKMRGLVYGLFYPSLQRIGHCGLTERLQGDLVFGIEANTSLAGSREGDGVYRKIRHKRTIYCYADWTKKGGVQ